MSLKDQIHEAHSKARGMSSAAEGRNYLVSEIDRILNHRGATLEDRHEATVELLSIMTFHLFK